MGRPINAGFSPAQIIQQYEYYQYPVQQLIATLGAKEQQQEKAIDSLSEFDSELGKYNALPGDVTNRDNTIKEYNTLKDITANQDLTSKTGRKAIMDFKSKLSSDIFPKLSKYHASAEAFKENYKQETEKLGKGESIPHTLFRLNDIAKSWDSNSQGVFTGLQRGKYMDFASYIKEKHPELLKGGWDPSTIGNWQKIFDNGFDQVIESTALKTISKDDLMAAYTNYKSYLSGQGYYDDFNYTIQKNFNPQQAAAQAITTLTEKSKDDFESLKKEAASYKGEKDFIVNTARILNIPESIAQQFLEGKGKNNEVNSMVEAFIANNISNKLNKLSPEELTSMGYEALTTDYLVDTELSPILDMYQGRIVDMETRSHDLSDYAAKTRYKANLDRENALAVAAATKPVKDRALTSYEASYELDDNQVANYVTKEGWDDFSLYINTEYAVNRLERKQNRTDLENTKLAELKGQAANLKASAVDYNSNILSRSGVPPQEAKTILEKIRLNIGNKPTDISQIDYETAFRGTTFNEDIAAGRNINMSRFIDALMKLSYGGKSAASRLVEDIIKNPSTGILRHAVKNSNIVKTKRSTAIGKSAAYDDFKNNIGTVYQGNAEHALTEDERKVMQITDDGKIIIPATDKSKTKVYELNSSDKINLSRATDLTLAAQEEESTTLAEQEIALDRRIERAYKTISNLASRTFLEPIEAPKYTLLHSDAINDYYIYRDHNAEGLATLAFKPKGSNRYQAMMQGNISYSDSKALLRDFYRVVLNK